MIGTFSHSSASLSDHDFSREYIVQEDLTKAARKVSDAKKHESMSLAITFLFNALKDLSLLLSQIGVFCIGLSVYACIIRVHTTLYTSSLPYLRLDHVSGC